MSAPANPSLNPVNNDALIGAFTFILAKFLQGVDDMLPARVIAFNRTTNRVQVQPMIAMVTTENERVSRAQIASLPVLQMGGGAFILNFNLLPGDLGWIKANDRDISLFKQSYEEAVPNTKRIHNFSDAIFIPDVMHNYTIAEEDALNAVWQILDASTRIALWTEFVKITAPRGLGINCQPDANAIFEVQSVTKASIPWPLMSEAERDAIPSPQRGMVVYNTDTDGISVYNGSMWS